MNRPTPEETAEAWARASEWLDANHCDDPCFRTLLAAIAPPTDDEIARLLVADDGLYAPGERFDAEVQIELREMKRHSSRVATIARMVRHFFGPVKP